MDEEFKVCTVCKSEFEGEGDKCEMCAADKGDDTEDDSEEGVDRNER